MKHAHEYLEVTLLTEKVAAAYISVSPSVLKLSRHTGYLFKGVDAPRHIRLGRAIRYSKQSLDLWVSSLPEFAHTADARSKGLSIRVISRRRS